MIAELAHHHHAAIAVGDPERAFTFAWRAAERASRLHAHEQAALHYGQAVQALEHGERPDPARRLEALLALGEAQRLAAHREGRRATFTEAIEAAQALGRPIHAARAAIGFCDLSEWAPRDDEARSALERALAELPDGADEERVRIQARLGYLSAREAVERAEPVAREALALARRLGEPGILQEAIYALAFLLAGPDHLEERAALALEAEAIVRESGATDTSIILFLDVACDRLTLGDVEGARARRAFADELAGGQPHPGRTWHLRVYDAGVALLEGRITDAERLREEADRLGARIAHPYSRGVSRGNRAALARLRGDEVGVLEIFEAVLPVRQGPVHWVQAYTARALAAVGRKREAEAFLEDLASPTPARIPRNIRWHATMAELAHLVADVGDGGRADEMIAALSAQAAHHGLLPLHIAYAGPFSFAIGRLHALAGRLGEARDALEEAVSACDDVEARPSRARVLLELGRVLARCGERAAARDALQDSARLAAALGMAGVEAAAKRAGSAPE